MVVVVNLENALETWFWTRLYQIVLWGTIAVHFLVHALLYSTLLSKIFSINYSYVGVAQFVLTSRTFWLTLLLTAAILLLPIFAREWGKYSDVFSTTRTFIRTFDPSDRQMCASFQWNRFSNLLFLRQIFPDAFYADKNWSSSFESETSNGRKRSFYRTSEIETAQISTRFEIWLRIFSARRLGSAHHFRTDANQSNVTCSSFTNYQGKIFSCLERKNNDQQCASMNGVFMSWTNDSDEIKTSFFVKTNCQNSFRIHRY